MVRMESKQIDSKRYKPLLYNGIGIFPRWITGILLFILLKLWFFPDERISPVVAWVIAVLLFIDGGVAIYRGWKIKKENEEK